MNKPKNNQAAMKVSQALTQLLLQEPFFGALAMRLNFVEDATIPTACTNGKNLRYNPKFIESLTHDVIKFVIIHEVQHCAKLHIFRREGRDSEIFNQACDYIVNNELKDAGYKVDAEWLSDPQFSGMSEEQVYTVLQQKKQQKKQNGGSDGISKPGMGEFEDGPDIPGECKEEQEQNWKQAVLQAAQQAKQYGKLPAFIEKMVDELKNPVVDWKAVLRKFIETTARNDFTWTRPNRRFLGLGIYLPSIQSEKLPPIVVYQDTSGSRWSNEQIQFACSEIAAIVMDAKPERTYVVCGDTRVCSTNEFEPGDVVKFDPKGGGGTAFEPIFEWVKEQGIEPCCFIGVTDLEGSFPDVAPEYPVIWICDQKGNTAPFGEVVEVRL